MRRLLAAVAASLALALAAPVVATADDAPPAPTPAPAPVIPATYSFLDTYVQPPVLSQSGPSCVGYSFATALSALTEVQTGAAHRFDGEAIYRPIQQTGGGAYPEDAVSELETYGATDAAGQVWKVTDAEWIDVHDEDAVRRAMIAGHVIVSDFLFAGGWNGRVAHYRAGQKVDGAHEMTLIGYRPHRLIGQNTWGEIRDGLGHGHGLWRLTWNYWRHYAVSAVALTIARY